MTSLKAKSPQGSSILIVSSTLRTRKMKMRKRKMKKRTTMTSTPTPIQGGVDATAVDE
jgi:hypothetical protein